MNEPFESTRVCPSGIVCDQPSLDAKGRPAARGTKHFAPGTRVYVLPHASYDIAYYERALVVGSHRDDGKVACVWIDLRRLEAFEVSEEFPEDIEWMLKAEVESRFVKPWTGGSAAQFVKWRNSVEPPQWETVNRLSLNKKGAMKPSPTEGPLRGSSKA